METIRNYLEMMFQKLPNTPEVQKAKFELGQMMEDKYNELIQEGQNENEAVGTVIAEFGNLDELAESLGIQNFMNQNAYQGSYQDPAANAASYTKAPKNKNCKDYSNPMANTIMSLFWPTATCLYLSWSFLTFDWHITWVIWPLAGILHAIFNSIFNKED